MAWGPKKHIEDRRVYFDGEIELIRYSQKTRDRNPLGYSENTWSTKYWTVLYWTRKDKDGTCGWCIQKDGGSTYAVPYRVKEAAEFYGLSIEQLLDDVATMMEYCYWDWKLGGPGDQKIYEKYIEGFADPEDAPTYDEWLEMVDINNFRAKFK